MIRTALRLLAFSIVCLLFTLWLAFTIGNIRPFQDRYRLSASFDDVTGLLVNDNVKVAGVVVGKVSGIRVDEGEAVVDFEVDDDVVLPTDTQTAVRWRNLLGQRYLYLYPGESAQALERGAHIPSDQALPIVDLGELFNRLGPIVRAIDPDQVNAFLEAFTGALEGGNDLVLGQSLADLGTIFDTLAEKDEAIGRLVENLATLTDALAARDRQIRTVLDNITELAATFNEHSDVVVSTVDDLGTFSQSLGTLIEQNRPAIDRIITRVAELVAVVDGRIDTIDRTLTDLDETGHTLFNAARYGEWLNQFIVCTTIDPDGAGGLAPIRDDDHCTSTGSGAGAAATTTPPHDVAAILTAALGGAG